MKNILIIIPAYREHKNILNLLNKIFINKSKKYNFCPLVIDDSDDLSSPAQISKTDEHVTEHGYS